MNKIVLLAAAASAIAATPSNAATLFSFDTANSFVDVTSNRTACIGNCRVTATLLDLPSFSLDVGESYTFDFARFRVGSGFGFGFGSADVSAQLAFLTPGGSAATTGAGNYFRIGGLFLPTVVGGKLDWATNAQQITAANGTKFTVSFADLEGFQWGKKVYAPVTVTLDSLGGGGVPEPATWALMILGFGAIGGALRSRRRQISATVRFA